MVRKRSKQNNPEQTKTVSIIEILKPAGKWIPLKRPRKNMRLQGVSRSNQNFTRNRNNLNSRSANIAACGKKHLPAGLFSRSEQRARFGTFFFGKIVLKKCMRRKNVRFTLHMEGKFNKINYMYEYCINDDEE